MKKRMIIPAIIFAFLVFLMMPSTLQAESTSQIDIGTKTNGYLFDLSNLKPGDRAYRILTIQNRGQRDFSYNTTAKFQGGDEKLYNEFLLKVSDANGTLHEGYLKDFRGLTPRFLKSINEEDLMFELEFPYELGNEFQGLGFEVEFRFIVEGYDPPPGGGGGGSGGGSDNLSNPDKPNTPTQPGDPENPDDSIIPEDPGDPQEQTNPLELQDPDKIYPQHPIDPEKLNSPPVDGQILPSTATNTFNFVLGGFALLAIGGILLFFRRERTMVIKK
ncbi:LPXTG cell wall anchor domain-containing protein [Schinkia azotoformans]|uniref:LPXTG cell wall anchor domain-containing protein n=1 Tax=Schinkia azotoformans TaxID=1454 RepID=UPI002DB5BEE8|nr:LPXTG cell wall anchor domain-containing protein [Schinkia azotoformans]MEC1721283.1 LPXTG cell wall anchor domain-containing protein [Schinkia azotoformans]MED4352436.1 LPXTG cell wall anchor domain-containing protein [Schinkia azotoformans]MED4414430.1 LPXTG cell wall anchor domain-containing protein [Schinkia azotoformans]